MCGFLWCGAEEALESAEQMFSSIPALSEVLDSARRVDEGPAMAHMGVPHKGVL